MMVSTLKTRAIVLFACLFMWLDLYPFDPPLQWINSFEFTMVFFLVVANYNSSMWVVVMAFACGIFQDALSAVPFHTAVMVGLFYGAQLLRRMFYYPGAPAHVASFFALIIAAVGAGFVFEKAHIDISFQIIMIILKSSILNFAWFLALLSIFNKRDQAVTFKMMR